MDSEKIAMIATLKEEVIAKNIQIEELLINFKGEVKSSTECNHWLCSCDGYTKGNEPGKCGTCFHPAYEHI